MIKSIAIPLLVLSCLIAYKKFQRNKRQLHVPPTNQFPITGLNSVFIFSKRVVSNIPSQNYCCSL